ncbi:Abscisic acid 8'-hydroxylase 4 [Glycine soja]
MRKQRRRITNIISDIMCKRKENFTMERYLLGHLLNYNDEKGQMLSDDQIAESEDTTASVLTWILKYLEDDHKLLEAIKAEKMGVYKANEGGNMPLAWGQA